MILFAQKHELSMVFETSAKTNYGMDDMIYEIAVEIDHCRHNFDHIYNKRSASVALHKNQQHPLKADSTQTNAGGGGGQMNYPVKDKKKCC